MNPVEATTGHSAVKERSIARILYFCLIVAIGIAIAVFFLVGQDKDMQPPTPEGIDITPRSTPTL